MDDGLLYLLITRLCIHNGISMPMMACPVLHQLLHNFESILLQNLLQILVLLDSSILVFREVQMVRAKALWKEVLDELLWLLPLVEHLNDHLLGLTEVRAVSCQRSSLFLL